ncbi:MAG: transposase [Boseongicola sp.]|nr:transposase [Boseongicola sp.]
MKHEAQAKPEGKRMLPSVPDARIVQARVVKSALRVSVQFVVELEDRPSEPVGEPIGIDMGIRNRAIMSSGETVPAVTIDRRPLKRAQRVVSRAKKGSASRRKKVKALAREWERTRIRERNALHEISAGIVKRHSRIAVEDLQVSNMMRHPTLARRMAEQQWGRLVQQLTCKAESAGGKVVRVRPQHTSTDCHACGHRQKMPLDVREFACGGCGLVTDRDVNAARNVLRRGIALAGWEIGPSGCPGASGDVLAPHVAGLPGQGAERHAGEHDGHSCILFPKFGRSLKGRLGSNARSMYPASFDTCSEHVDLIDTSPRHVDTEKKYRHVEPWQADGPALTTAVNQACRAMPSADGSERLKCVRNGEITRQNR